MIEFIESKGINLSTGEEQSHPQDRIYVDGQLVGFLGHKKKAPVALIRPVSEAERYEIHQMAAERKGPTVSIIGPPKPIPPEYYATEEDDDE